MRRHSSKHFVFQGVMMDERGHRMQKREAEQDIGGESMPMGYRSAQSRVAKLRHIDNIEKAGTPNKRVDDAERYDCQKQGVKQTMRRFGKEMENAGIGGGQPSSAKAAP